MSTQVSFRIAKKFGLIFIVLVGFCFAGNYTERKEVTKFIKQLAVRNSICSADIKEILSSANYSAVALKHIARPAESLPWYRYKSIFLTAGNVKKGVRYWRQNAKVLKEASALYGVPPEIIVAIIGVESNYNASTDRLKVLDTLTTLAFDYPLRQKFFRSELECFLVLAHEGKVDPYLVKGSYAGAMGKPQFMPSSFRDYAIDFNADGQLDLWGSDADVIGSVANYFQKHGWQNNQKVVVPAQVSGVKHQKILYWKLIPRVPVSRLKYYGVEIAEQVPEKNLVTLLKLQNKDSNEYWVGLNNFYVITRYNRSTNYGMAVYQLAEKIRKAYYK